MNTYKLLPDSWDGSPTQVVERLNDQAFIPFALDNTDYQNFKAQINADEAQLQDVDGNTMVAAEAKAYIATLP